jgi:type IV pilus assembly protein PilC
VGGDRPASVALGCRRMPLYRYRAIDRSGRTAKGLLGAESAEALERELERVGLTLVRAVPQRSRDRGRFSQRVARRELIQFCFQLEQLTAAGVPLVEGLQDLRDGADQPALCGIAAAMVESITSGRNLSQALAEHPAVFDEVFVGLVRAGEHAGKLPAVLASLGAQLRWEEEIAARTRTLLQYPLFVGGVVVALIAFLLVYLVPQLAGFIRGLGHALPLQTRALLWASDVFIRHGWMVLLSAAVLAATLGTIARRSPWLREPVDRLKLAVPLFGPILRKLILARFAAGFALMYGSGILVLDALRHLEGLVGNRVLQRALHAAAGQVADGRPLAAAFAQLGVFPPLVIRMLRIGEQTGALDTALRSVSDFYHREVREAVDRLQALAEPVLTVLLGALLAAVMLAVLGPVYDTIAGVKL